MRSYFEEVKDFYIFVTRNFNIYKKRKLKRRIQAKMPDGKVEEKSENRDSSYM